MLMSIAFMQLVPRGVRTDRTEPRGVCTRLETVELDGLKAVRVQQKFLVNPPYPGLNDLGPRLRTAYQSDSQVRVKNLPDGKYTLKIDGRPVAVRATILAKPVLDAPAADWLKMGEAGGLVAEGPSLDQSEKL